MTDLIKPDLSKDTTGPFVTATGDAVEYAGKLMGAGSYCYVFRYGDALIETDLSGTFAYGRAGSDSDFDIFLAPKEPKTVFVTWWDSGPGDACETAEEAWSSAASFRSILQLEVDDQGVPVHDSRVRRVEL